VRSFYVHVNDVRLNVTDWGGEGNGLFFAHPTGFMGAIWDPIIEELRRRGFSARILTFDQRGHGLSSKPDVGYEWSRFVDDVGALARELEVQSFVGVGHSAGATTLACVAARDPTRFRRLLLIDPILFDRNVDDFDPGAGNSLSQRTRTRRLVWSSRAELFESFRARFPYDTWTDAALASYVEKGTFERPDGEIELLCPGRIESQIYQNAASINAYACLRQLAIPVLVVRGERSDSFTASRHERAMASLADGRSLVVPGASHYVPMEKPALVADLVLAEYSA
jgi:pimeloyl-ACP methyl ester carboxylesterase